MDPPKAKIMGVNESGIFDLSFTNGMSVREEITTLNQDGILLGQERVEVNYLLINIIPDDEENLENLQMDWHVVSYTSRSMQV